jgi:hypothetical protein
MHVLKTRVKTGRVTVDEPTNLQKVPRSKWL